MRLTVSAAPRISRRADLGGARERDLAHAGVGHHDRGQGGGVLADDDREHACRQAGALEQAGQGERRQRRQFRWLHDHRAAGGQGRPELAGDHRRREVPGGDRDRHADRPFEHEQPLVGVVARQDVAVDAVGLLAEPLEKAGGVGDLAARVGQRLSLLEGHQTGEALGLIAHRRGHGQENGAAIVRRPLRPVALGGARRLDGLGHVGLRGIGDLGERLAGRRVLDAKAPTADRREPAAADKQGLLDQAIRSHSSTALHRLRAPAPQAAGRAGVSRGMAPGASAMPSPGLRTRRPHCTTARAPAMSTPTSSRGLPANTARSASRPARRRPTWPLEAAGPGGRRRGGDERALGAEADLGEGDDVTGVATVLA